MYSEPLTNDYGLAVGGVGWGGRTLPCPRTGGVGSHGVQTQRRGESYGKERKKRERLSIY